MVGGSVGGSVGGEWVEKRREEAEELIVVDSLLVSAVVRWLLLMMVADALLDLLFVVFLCSFVLFSQAPRDIPLLLFNSIVLVFFPLSCFRALVSRTTTIVNYSATFENDQ